MRTSLMWLSAFLVLTASGQGGRDLTAVHGGGIFLLDNVKEQMKGQLGPCDTADVGGGELSSAGRVAGVPVRGCWRSARCVLLCPCLRHGCKEGGHVIRGFFLSGRP